MSRSAFTNISNGVVIWSADAANKAYEVLGADERTSNLIDAVAKHGSVTELVSAKAGLSRVASTMGVASAALEVSSGISEGFADGVRGEPIDFTDKLIRTASNKTLSVLTDFGTSLDAASKGEIVHAATTAVNAALAASSLHITVARSVSGQVVGHLAGAALRTASESVTPRKIPEENLLSPREEGFSPYAFTVASKIRRQHLADNVGVKNTSSPTGIKLQATPSGKTSRPFGKSGSSERLV